MPAHRVDPKNRFWNKVEKQGEDESSCWVWTGKKNSSGYGVLCIDKLDRRSHILSWTWENGPVPEGLELDHLCRNRACVRPSHLEAVTHKVNMERGALATKTHCANGHPRTPENTGINSKEGWTRCLVCHRERERKRNRKKKEVPSVA